MFKWIEDYCSSGWVYLYKFEVIKRLQEDRIIYLDKELRLCKPMIEIKKKQNGGSKVKVTRDIYLKAIELLCDKMIENIEEKEFSHEYSVMNNFALDAWKYGYYAMKEIIAKLNNLQDQSINIYRERITANPGGGGENGNYTRQ